MNTRRNTLYLGNSHLVPVEMVQLSFRFCYRGRWQITERRRILAGDLPWGTLGVYGDIRSIWSHHFKYRILERVPSIHLFTRHHPPGGEMTWLNSTNTKPTQVPPGGISSPPSMTQTAFAPSPSTSHAPCFAFASSCSALFPRSTAASSSHAALNQFSSTLPLASSTAAYFDHYHHRTSSHFIAIWLVITSAMTVSTQYIYNSLESGRKTR